MLRIASKIATTKALWTKEVKLIHRTTSLLQFNVHQGVLHEKEKCLSYVFLADDRCKILMDETAYPIFD